MQEKISNFTDLKTWQIGHDIVLNVYRLTKSFPGEEQFGLTSQLKRAAVSITSNLAEGFSRSTIKDKARFYSIALGSIAEVQNQILIGRDLGYISTEDYSKIINKITEALKMTQGLIKSAISRS